MDKIRLFHWLSKQDSSVLLDLLSAAYDELNHDQRQAVFGHHSEAVPPAPVDGETLFKEVRLFRQESLHGAYYAPFNMNSRNFSYVPEETKEWFDRLDDLLDASSELTAQGDHTNAVACFNMLYQLIDAMEGGEEIVFADEYGSSMIPGDEKQYIAAFMASLAATSTPEEFARVALPLIRRDSQQSFTTGAYSSAVRAATEVQRAHLEAEIQRQNLRTRRDI
ncbi:MAG: hypothetical protein HY675_23420 [Chloroflexi bacterium]|nr:hypothetical protein [Chloroflexota bacterium]